MRASLIISAVLYLSTIGFGATVRCPTCRGNACNENVIPLEECDPENNKLPFNFQLKQSELTEFFPVCVELEYVNDLKVTPVKQCLLVTHKNYLCSEIVESLPRAVKLANCWVNENEENEEAEENTTTEKPAEENTTTEKPAEENTTTEEPAEENTTTEKPAEENTTTEKPAEENTTTEKPAEENTTTEGTPSTVESTESVSVTTVEIEVTTQGSSIACLSLLTISIALCIQIAI